MLFARVQQPWHPAARGECQSLARLASAVDMGWKQLPENGEILENTNGRRGVAAHCPARQRAAVGSVALQRPRPRPSLGGEGGFLPRFWRCCSDLLVQLCVSIALCCKTKAGGYASGTGGKSHPRVGRATCSISRLQEGLRRALLENQVPI